MTEAHSLIAFLATVLAIVVLAIVGAVASYLGAAVEAMGIGAAITGLIGVLGTFRPKQPQPATSGEAA